MKILTRFASLAIGLLFLLCANQKVLAQSTDPNNPSASYLETQPIALDSLQPIVVSPSMTLVYPAGAATSQADLIAGSSSTVSTSTSGIQGTGAFFGNRPDNDSPRINLPGLDTIPTFAGAFAAQGGPSLDTVFPYIMIGNHPLLGGTTVIPAKITAFSLQLLNADGSVNLNVPFAPFEDLTLDSPNFREFDYTSGRHTQFADAVQRAEFFNMMGEDWHTVLRPKIVDRVTLQIPQFVQVQFSDGSVKTVQAYFIKKASNGNQFIEVLDLLFNALNTSANAAEINAGNYTTDAINMNFYPNTFLFSIDNQGNFAGCCVLGFHSYFRVRNVTPQPRWITLYASWTSPGIFGGGVQDVTPLSHEISESFNDPFINTTVPTWQFPGVAANARVCQGNLETGDPVEVLPTSTVNITLRERNEVFTYHPQTEALLQWFEVGATSNAIGGAFSYPNTTALTHSALPCPSTPPTTTTP